MDKLFSDETILLTEHFDAHQDWDVPIAGFFIVASKDESKRSIADLSEDELREFFAVVKGIRLAMRDILGIEDVYLFQNEDASHGFHLWLFPRHKWMEEFGRKIESVRPIIEFAKTKKTMDADIAEVKDAAAKARGYLNKTP